ncbi:MAG: 3-dehydroquinate synthase [Anaerolineaceae bacterium]|nr:MAG: 3-dehydroquinate synthase [Anaerolineaceae bacterium]
MAVLPVTTPQNGYDIHIEAGLYEAVIADPGRFGIRQPVVVSNDTIAPLHASALAEALHAPLLLMRDGEAYKTLDTVADLYAQMVARGADRASTVIALGGGVVGDTAGFVAATYMRGVRLVQAPTSLLAMVDSSVGGKVGVDLPAGKNLAGAFKQPDAVLIDTDTLHTLPDVEWVNGLAEVVKHGLIADPALLDPAALTRERAVELVKRAVAVKIAVVQRDPYERGERAHLNLGHTFAHAIEQVSGYAWAHGQAVGVGLLAAARLSHALNLCDARLVDSVDGLLRQIGLPTRIDGLESAALWAAMSADKKWQSGVNRFVLLRGIGQPLIMENVSKDAVIDVLDGLR